MAPIAAGGVQLGARGGEAQRADLDALLDDGGHARHVLGGGPFVIGAALAHDIGAHGAVGNLGADIDGAGKLLHRVEVLGETFPIPLHALVQRGAGNVLHVLDHGDQAVVGLIVGFTGREADTAVAHDQGGNAVVGGRAAQRVPGGLAVHVGVHVHPARGEQFARGVDFLPAGACDRAHGGNLAAADRQVPGEGTACRYRRLCARCE